MTHTSIIPLWNKRWLLEPNMPKTKSLRIVIDGPVGAGKTTVGRRVARLLGYRFLDTGLMYRALTWVAIERGLAPNDEEGLVALACGSTINIQFGCGGEAEIEIDGTYEIERLRTQKVDDIVSTIATMPKVREALVGIQRSIGKSSRIVMVGRDIGSVVLHDAELKVFLTADVKERASRRFRELSRGAKKITYDDVLCSLAKRDAVDSERDISPLMPAEDACIVDTNGLTIDQVTEAIIKLVEMR